jgi:hypothetical protein
MSGRRYIDNLPEWPLEDLIRLHKEAKQSIDAAHASGNPDSAIVTDAQFNFIQTLIERKGGENE